MILPLVKAAGVSGVTRKHIGSAVELERDVLDQLLAGMVGAGLLILSRDARGPVYHYGHVFNLGRSSAASL